MVVINKNYVNNNPLLDTDTVVIVPTYDGHLMFLKKVLEQYKKTGKYVICAYDRHSLVPPMDILDVPNAWVWKHKTFGAEKRNGWLWLMVYASGIVESFQNIEYVILCNGDCIWEKPENVNNLIDLMGQGDIFSASCDSNLIHTCNMVWRRSCFLSFVEEIKEALNQNRPESHSPEVLLRDWKKSDMIFTNTVAQVQPIYPKNHFYEGKIDHYSAYGQDSTFKQVVGYRNLGAEHKHSCLEHLEPVDKKYIDMRDGGVYFNKHEKETLFEYYKTGDRRWLYKYFSEGEDSYWNRRYYPIEYYGNEVLKDDSKRKEFGPPSERTGCFNRWEYNSFVLKDEDYENKWKDVIEKTEDK